MSSTNRGAARSPQDHYATPQWAIDAILPHLCCNAGSVLDVGCGDGRILQGVERYRKTFWPHGSSSYTGIDINETRTLGLVGSGFYVCDDYLSDVDTIIASRYDLIIGNPPYSRAMEFVEKSLKMANKEVAMLLRLSFLASKKRKDFHNRHPSDVYVLSQRPQFCLNKNGKKGSDSSDYSWFVWRNNGSTRGTWRIL